MANENNPHKAINPEPGTGEVQGRTFNSQNPGAGSSPAGADISAVDQQEGTMNHGETGGHSVGQEEKNPASQSNP